MNTAELAHAKVLIIGGGVTGTSVADVLEKLGSEISIIDEDKALFADARFITSDEAISNEWSFAIVSPGWRTDHPLIEKLRDNKVTLMSEVDLAWHLRCEIKPSQKWLAVTGTNGKTTTVELATAMLRAGGLNATACGNVGDTVIEAVLSEINFDYLVLELSSFQLQWSEMPEFHTSAILNIADDHVDWHGSFEEYVNAKLRILERCELAVLNADDSSLLLSTAAWRGHKVFYSLNPPKPGELGVVEDLLVDRAFVSDPQEAEMIAELADIQPRAPHNVSNALAASGLARSVGISHEIIRGAIQAFRPGRHRIELVLEYDGVSWINDSKATNPHAAAASLSSQLSVIWIAGGLAKGASMHDLVARCKGRIKSVILIGQDRELIVKELVAQAPDIKIVRVDEDSDSEETLMERVVMEAKKLAKPGDVVLLAPSCASMDQFVSYADRGDQFCAAVKKLVQS